MIHKLDMDRLNTLLLDNYVKLQIILFFFQKLQYERLEERDDEEEQNIPEFYYTGYKPLQE